MSASTINSETEKGISRLPVGPEIVRWIFGSWSVLVFAFLYVPILLLAIYSFNDSKLNIRWKGFTLDWYAALFRNEVLLTSFKNSLIIAGAVTLLATFLGTTGAWLLYRYKFPAPRLLGLLIFIPMVIPEVLLGASLRLLFVSAHFPLGYWSVIIAHTTFCFPFVLIAVQARLDSLDPSLEEAALDLGAKPAGAFWLVIVPYLMPAIISGGLMSFTLSMDEYLVTVFTYSADAATLPIKVYGMVKKGLDPQLNALSTLFIAGTALLVILSEILRKRGAK